jgi:GMP synthase (glutamine-hydrolysing)
MRALAIVHQPDAGPGVFADPFAQRPDWELVEWLIAADPQPPLHPASADAVLTFGGAMHADQEASHGWLASEKELLRELLAAEVPLLGVCLGAQLLAEAAGTRVRRAREPEIGWIDVEVGAEGAADPLIGALAPRFSAFEWHSYEIPLPEGAVALARSENVLQAFRIGERAWGIQFHAEVSAGDADSWILDYDSDEDAVRMPIDWAAFREQTARAMPDWNELGRALCSRFLAAAMDAGR